MMPVYYKYTNFYGIKHLKNYTIRLSSPITLNDPFEGRLNGDVLDFLKQKLEPEHLGLPSSIKNKKAKELISRLSFTRIKNIVNPYGIVSLSETPRNLLMWAHYANEHRGICIGFKPDLFDSQDAKLRTTHGAESYLPIKVNYDSQRPQNTSDELDINEEIKLHIRNQLLTKSNDWMYEKEHRCILPLNWADQFKRTSDNFEEDLINDLIDFEILHKVDNNTFEGDGITTMSVASHSCKEAVFLKKVDLSKIVSIHFGCNMNQNEIEQIINEVNTEGSKLSHVKLYECSPSINKFELIEDQIIDKNNAS
ncbi:DUF2971 domain-containing protein [Aeromonas bestiarum]|uniref:DUF2971 domain-containing protein n=1 Tax=Aeromonas bestiarum TaxID=105751 RepID=UPI003673099C